VAQGLISNTKHTCTGEIQKDHPCMHHDMVCPHFATRTAGLVKDKFTGITERERETHTHTHTHTQVW
jgi:hypothetical protein